MRNQGSKLFFALATISLVVFLGVIFVGSMKKASQIDLANQASKVLGAITNISGQGENEGVKRKVQKVVEDTKETLSQKAIEVEKDILTKAEKEISDLTQAQIKAVKTDICRNWGVISPVPTLTP